MKKIRKSIAFLLAAVMLLTTMQITAFADEIRYDDSGSNDTVSWSYTASTDTLYINGDVIQLMNYGALPAYKDGGLVENLRFSHLVFGKDVREIRDPGYAGYTQCYDPLEYAYKDSRFDITFEEGSVLELVGALTFSGSTATLVTLPDNPNLSISIEEQAFAYSNLESFTMYDNVYSLGMGVFGEDSALTNISLSSKLSVLEEYAFFSCQALTDIVIPEGVTTIENYCFNECSALERVSIPSTVTVIGDYAFADCTSLKSAVIPDNVKRLSAYVFARCTSLESLDLGNITTINANSLNGCTALKSLAIPSGITSIPARAFEGLTALEAVDLGNVTKINNYAFQKCTSLKSVILPDTVTSLGGYAFNQCSSLSDVTLSKNLTAIKGHTFSGCNISDPVINEGITEIAASAFTSGCSGSITFPSTLVSIGASAFESCNLTSIDFGENGEYLSIGSKAFAYNDNLTGVTLTPRVVDLGTSAFYSCDNLKTINFETRENGLTTDEAYNIDGLYAMGRSPFEGTIIESLVLPQTLESLDEGALGGMSELTKIDMSATNITTLPSSVFGDDVMLFEIKYPKNLTVIDSYAFGLAYIKNVTIPETVTTINDCAFSESLVGEVTIPKTVKNFGTCVFQNANGLIKANIEADITELPAGTFLSCQKLESVTLPENLTAIGESAFADCINLTLESIPNTVERIDADAFCNSPVNFALPSSLKSLGEGAFQSTEMTSAVFTQPDCTIGTLAFYHADKLTEVVLPANLTEIPDNCFNGTAITQIDIPESITRIGDNSFANTPLNSFDFPNTLQHIDTSSFRNCINLKEADLSGTKLTYINSKAFSGCKSLSKVILPNALTGIASNAFYDCTALKNISIPEKVDSIGTDAFYNCPLNAVEILNPTIALNQLDNSKIGFTANGKQADLMITGCTGSAVQTYAENNNFKFYAIGYYDQFNTEVPDEGTIGTARWFIEGTELHIAGTGPIETAEFYAPYEDKQVLYNFAHIVEDKGITKLVVENGITSLPDSLFADKEFDHSTLTEVSLPNTLESIGSYTFATSKIKSIVIPDSVSSIGAYAFYQADLSESVQLGNGITEIPAFAFAESRITSLTVPSGVTSIDEGAFLDCLSLTYLSVPKTVVNINEGSRTSRPIGITSKGVLLDGLYMDVEADSEALSYAQIHSIRHDTSLDGNVLYGRFGDSMLGNTWHYNPETKNMYITVTAFSSNNNLYLTDGTRLNSGELEVELLTVDCSTSITGFKSTSPFARINPKRISLPNNLVNISDYSFANLTRLTSITIPDSVTSISNTAFKNCARLKGINFGNGLRQITTGICKNMNSLQAVEFGSSTQSIEYAAFYGCTNLQSVHIPESVTEIKENAFANCYGLISIVNDSKANIRRTAFENLPLLEEIVLNSNFTTSNEDFYDVFSNNTGKNRNNLVISFTGDITTADIASYSYANATKYYFGPNVTDVVFRNDLAPVKVESLTVDKENPVLYTYGNCLYKKGTDSSGNETNTLILAQNTKGSVSAKAGTTDIGENAFFNNEVSSVLLPSSVKTIGKAAFEQCKELKTISIPEALTVIGEQAFKNCIRLKTMNIASAQTIGNNAFEGCINLSSVILPENVEIINDYVFKDCTALIGIVIPSKTQTISANAFNGCTTCNEVYIWDTAIKDTEDRFTDCANLILHTMAGSNAYAYAREHNIPYTAYTDRDVFYDLCAMKLDVYAGYLGFCDDGHGDTQYLTVYEATCDLDGYIIGVCEYCSEILEEIHTNAIGHSYYIAADIPATETTQGVTKYICTNCDDTYYTYTPALSTDAQQTTITATGTVTIATSSTAVSGSVPVYSASILVDGCKVATTDEDGRFSLSLRTGVHEISIRYAYGIERTVYIVAENKDIDCGSIPIIACDWDKNNVIDEEDINLFKLVISSRPTDPSYLRFVDLNGDNYINAKDMAIIRSCMKYDQTQYNSLIIKAS